MNSNIKLNIKAIIFFLVFCMKGQYSIGQDVKIEQYETSEYIVFYDKEWTLVKGNNLVELKILNQAGGLQYNLVIEEGLEEVNNNITIYAIASINNLNKIISDFELIDALQVDRDDAVIIAYKGIAGNKLSTFLQYYIVTNNKAYILTSRYDNEIDLTKLKKLAKLMPYVFDVK